MWHLASTETFNARNLKLNDDCFATKDLIG